MWLMKRYHVRSYEMGLLFREGEFQGLIEPGKYRYFDPLNRVQMAIVSQREPWLINDKLDLLVKSGLLKNHIVVLDLKDHERALVWVDNRFDRILPAGLYAYWTGQKNVRHEIIDARQVQFEHPELKQIVSSGRSSSLLDICTIYRDRVGVLFIDGQYIKILEPGVYAFWKGTSEAKVAEVDLREAIIDVSGQDMLTADKVTLRLNLMVTYQITDARKAVSQSEDVRQALYRETQLVFRHVVSARELDIFLTEKEVVAQDVEQALARRAQELGLKIISAGIRDIILPGEMKDLMNRVTEAKKAAEANLIVRREETAAMRSQVNTAKLLADNPVLMRLRELEALEKVAATGKLNVILGEKGLAEKITNLI